MRKIKRFIIEALGMLGTILVGIYLSMLAAKSPLGYELTMLLFVAGLFTLTILAHAIPAKK